MILLQQLMYETINNLITTDIILTGNIISNDIIYYRKRK